MVRSGTGVIQSVIAKYGLWHNNECSDGLNHMVYRGREHHEKTRNKGTRVGAVVSIQVDQGRGEGRGGESRDRERLGGGRLG